MNPVFQAALKAYNDSSRLRATRRRLKNFTYGRQWDDIVVAADGTPETIGERFRRSGREPLTNNLLRSLVKSVVGRFRYNLSQATAITDERLRQLHDANHLDELDSRAMEEFLISGCVVQRVSYEHRFEGVGVWVDNVSPAAFFCNRFLDPRGNDLRLVGMLHSFSASELKLRFGHGDPGRCRQLDEIYASLRIPYPGVSLADMADSGPVGGFADASSAQGGVCRVIEVWTFEVDALADGSARPHWHCRYFAPDGTLIEETRSPYRHVSHPFVVKFYPLTDGEVHSFIEDVVDQQLYINRLITVIDAILAHSAKGVLLYPLDALPDGMELKDASRIWANPGGVLPVNPNVTQLPREVTTSGSSEGAAGLLEIQLRMLQQVSGVTSSLRGQADSRNQSASLYDSQVYNSAIALLDIFETFNAFRTARDVKALAVY